MSMVLTAGLVASCGSSSTQNKQEAQPPAATTPAASGQGADGTPAGNTAGSTTASTASGTSAGAATSTTSNTNKTSGDAVVIADSIGRGLFALYNYGTSVSSSDAQAILSVLEASNWDPANIWGEMQTSKFAEPRFSAYDGTGGTEQPTFHSLANLLGVTGTIYDAAEVGATISDTPTQLTSLAGKMATGEAAQVKKAIFALGNNDFCATMNESAAAFQQDFAASYLTQIRAVAAAFPAADLYVVTPLNQIQLKTITQNGLINLAGLTTANPLISMFTGNKISCSTLQNLYCPGLFAANAPAHMASLQQAVHAAVTSLAGELAKKGTQAVYFSDVSTISFTTDMLAVDCFHPNATGQMTLAHEAFSRAQKVAASASN